MKAMGEGQPSAWVTYVSVENADATVDLAKKAGATVFVEPMDVCGYRAHGGFRRSHGRGDRRLAAEDLQGAELANEAGAFAWNELNTRDLPAAKAFYTEVFGWTPNDARHGGNGTTRSGSSATSRWPA